MKEIKIYLGREKVLARIEDWLDIRDALAALKEVEAGHFVTLEELKKELGL